MVFASRRADCRLPDPTVWVAAMVLAIAGVSKAFSPVVESSPAALLTVGLFEVILALWLLGGWRRGIAEVIAALTFAVFAIYGMGRLWSGHLSCECFGQIAVPAAYTVGLSAFGGIAFIYRVQHWHTSIGLHSRVYTVVATMFAVFTVAAVARAAYGLSVAPSPDSFMVWAEELLSKLESQKHVGTRSGDWRILLIDPDCAACRTIRVSDLESGSTVIVTVRTIGDVERSALFVPPSVKIIAMPDLAPLCVPFEVRISNGRVASAGCMLGRDEFTTPFGLVNSIKSF